MPAKRSAALSATSRWSKLALLGAVFLFQIPQASARHRAGVAAEGSSNEPAVARKPRTENGEGDEAPSGGVKENEAAFRDEVDAFFESQAVIPRLSFTFAPVEWGYLRESNRRYAECVLREEGAPTVWRGTAVKLKGSAGSFQGPDQKPGLSVSMNKFKRAERWRGFLKWHLNNGAQDDSFLNEQMSCEMARLSGVPASRCAHAIVTWQGRPLGLYVIKEAFDKDFLAHFYDKTGGDLYEVGQGSDLLEEMEKSQGEPEHRENLKELIGACQEADDARRWERLGKILNVDEFLSFMAIEALTCHWDGYNFGKNNYRLYFNADTGKADFFLHGTDQTFTDAQFPIWRPPEGMVGQAVLSNPAWREAYHARLRKIYDEVLKPLDWPGRAVEIGERVKAALATIDEAAASEYGKHVEEARARLAERIEAIGKQFEMLKPVIFDAEGRAKLVEDQWRAEGEATMDQKQIEGKDCLHMRLAGKGPGSWRQTLVLDPGKYRIRGLVRASGVVAAKQKDLTGSGAGIRISGGKRSAPDEAVGTTRGWREVRYEFETAGGEVVVVAELRGARGEAWFDRASMEISRVR